MLKGTTEMNQDMLGDGPHDDTKVDLVKIMNRFQIDREIEEVY